MRIFLLILIFTFFPPLQCLKSNYFFVTRRDTKEAICISPKGGYIKFPTFNLDKLQIPADVGFRYWDWLNDWQLQNDTSVRGNDENKVLIAGSQPFHFVAKHYDSAFVYILASNITLWMARKNQARGAGMLFEVDHLNEATKLKDTSLKYCNRNPQRKKATCTVLDYKNETNFLNDGNHWTRFSIKIKENLPGIEMFERSYGKDNPVVQCTWNNANISNPFPPDKDFEVFAKSHQRSAAFLTYAYSGADLANNKEMKRKYTKRSSGKFCVEVWWNKKRSKDSIELMEAKNLATGRVQPPTNTTMHTDAHPLIPFYYTYFQWNHLEASEYEFKLRFDQRQPKIIDLCPESGSNILKTWRSMPKAITKCQNYVGFTSEYSVGPSSPPNPTLQANWTLGDWEHVCDRLGIASNDTEVQIKFCNYEGCNFSKCPNLHDEPPHIFDF